MTRSATRGCGRDPRLTKDAVQKGEVKFLWKMKLNGENRQLNSLTQPILLDRLISHRGFKALAFVGTSNERIFAIDTDLNRDLLGARDQLLVDRAARQQLVGVSGRADGGVHATDGRRASGVRRRSRRWRPLGQLGRRAGSRRAEPAARPGQGRGRANDPTPPAAGRGNTPAAPAAPQGRGAPSPGNGGGPTENVFVLASDGLVRALNTHNGTERFPATAVSSGECQARRA